VLRASSHSFVRDDKFTDCVGDEFTLFGIVVRNLSQSSGKMPASRGRCRYQIDVLPIGTATVGKKARYANPISKLVYRVSIATMASHFAIASL